MIALNWQPNVNISRLLIFTSKPCACVFKYTVTITWAEHVLLYINISIDLHVIHSNRPDLSVPTKIGKKLEHCDLIVALETPLVLKCHCIQDHKYIEYSEIITT